MPTFDIDPAIEVGHRALHGLWLKQKLSSENISNLETPGYKSRKMDFDAYMRDALIEISNASSPAAVDPNGYVKSSSSRWIRSDGNDVDLEKETVAMAENALRYRAVLTQLNRKFNLLDSVMRES